MSLEENIDILNTILNTVNECVVVVNENGIITMMSKAYKDFINCNNPEGKHVIDVIENTRLHKIIETGQTEIGDIQEINGNKMIAMRVPIKKDGKIIGAVGKVMFKNIGDFYSLSKKINNLEKEIEYYKNELSRERRAKYSFEDIIGNSKRMKETIILARKIAKSDSSVLITGESGTGKELFAHSIHNCSKRCLGPFIKINCAAIPSDLLEAELFGYEEGAFTGAKKGGKKGKFEIANKGTIFLDEIGDMPINMQVKLLRVIQEKEFERIGGNVLKNVDIRLMAATNKDIEQMIIEGKFREELYYRLNVMKLDIPPLRDRKEDILDLINNLRIKAASKFGIYVEGVAKNALECLLNYNWPGNVRELENVIESAVNLLDSESMIQIKHLPQRIRKNNLKSYKIENRDLKTVLEELEKECILECLKNTNWNKNKAAQILGISRVGLYKKIEYYKL